MTENDIYDNEGRYNRFVANLENLLNPPSEDDKRRKYYIKNKANLKYYKQLFKIFAVRDNAYIRRLRLLRVLLIVTHALEIDLAKATRDDIDTLIAFSHSINKSVKSKRDFILDLKYIWRQLFPETDNKGRPDETLTPYIVRHLSSKIDKSKEKLRQDKFSLDEFEKLVQAFSDEPRMQALLTICLESLARPQEILWRKIKDVEMHDNYAKIYISDHGKEGTGFLKIIDSYFYLAKWLNAHPSRKDKNAYLFINTGRRNRYEQLKPFAVNKLIRKRCEAIGIEKPITLYSLKRNGVTMMRLSGKSNLDIQHTARWTSTKQLDTYDLSEQEESFTLELIKRGKIKGKGKLKDLAPKDKTCPFCKAINGMAETFCQMCNRPLDKDVIDQQIKESQDMKERMKQMEAKLQKILEFSQFSGGAAIHNDDLIDDGE